MQQERHVQTQTDDSLDYLLYLPRDYAIETTKPWPLMIFLHGLSKRGSDLNLLKVSDIPQFLDDKPDFPFVVISPQCPAGSWWAYEVNAVKGVIEHALATYAVDPDRVYLTGPSMGGYGTWAVALRYPELFAAIAPIAGGGVPLLADKLKDVPVWAFHGDADDVIPFSESQLMVEALKAVGADVKFTAYPGCGHDTPAYDEPELYEWLLSHRRANARPHS